jgi:hypothetical protein
MANHQQASTTLPYWLLFAAGVIETWARTEGEFAERITGQCLLRVPENQAGRRLFWGIPGHCLPRVTETRTGWGISVAGESWVIVWRRWQKPRHGEEFDVYVANAADITVRILKKEMHHGDGMAVCNKHATYVHIFSISSCRCLIFSCRLNHKLK